MSEFVNEEIPFIMKGNRRALTAKQIMENPQLKEFVEMFRGSFDLNPIEDILLFREPD